MSKHGTYPNNPIIWPAVPVDHTGDDNLGYYATETSQRYAWGTRGMTWDGKVFRYGRAKGTTYAGFGVVNSASVDITDMLNTNFTKAIVAGDRSVLFTVTSTETFNEGGIAEDELVGAQYVVGHGSTATTEYRTIIGNSSIAAATTGTIMIYVDAPFALAHAAGFNELPLNPYGYLLKPANTIASVMGVPLVTATILQHQWIQTWGLCWCVPGGGDATPGDSYEHREVYFVGDGSVNGGNIVTIEDGFQRAGFITDSTESGSGTMPMVMLQISV